MAANASLRHRLTRRRLLQMGAGVGVAAIALGSGAAYLAWPRAAAAGRRVLAPGEVAFVAALAEAYLPPGNGVLEAQDYDVVTGVDAYVAMLPAGEQRLLRALLTSADQLPRLTLHARTRFSDMTVAARQMFLVDLERGARTQRELTLLLRMLVGIAVFDTRRAFDQLGFDWGCPVIP